MKKSELPKSFEGFDLIALNVLFISSYPPRECGIATFTMDLIQALKKGFGSSIQCSIGALETNQEACVYPEPPDFILNTEQSISYTESLKKINKPDLYNVVVIQHEFGFFNGFEADFCAFYQGINRPLIFVFHTVLPQPNRMLWKSVNLMVLHSNSVVVMTEHAKRILVEQYQISANKVVVISHGTHLLPHIDSVLSRKKHGLELRKVLSTFGLLGCNKSIETTLYALPQIAAIHPEVLFLILGKTHPGIVKNEGERYRNMLLNLVEDLQLQKHVLFVNQYLPLEELLEYLKLTDIYLFTSNDPNQAVSGTLSYAAASGCPIISTPIPHALELLGKTDDCSIEFGDHQQLSNQVIKLLSNPVLRVKLTADGLQKMANTSWPNAAIAYANLLRTVDGMRWIPEFQIPELQMDHLDRLTTRLGIVQFSNYDVPNLESGYTLDDNARALIVSCQYYLVSSKPDVLESIETYFNFIESCWQDDLKFLNYKDLENQFTSQNQLENLEDSMGRAVWALGFMISMKTELPTSLIQRATFLMNNIVPEVHAIHSTRSMSFIIKGLFNQNDEKHTETMIILADRLMNMYSHVKTENWNWFEDILTYANSVIPEALILAYARTGFTQYKVVAMESFDFLLSIILQNGELRVVSNNGWLLKDCSFVQEIGGEQPIDVAYTVIALESFYFILGIQDYKDKLKTVFTWFLGNNHLNQSMYNSATKGCYDGLEKTSVNLNQGAESTLSYLLARLAVERMIVHEHVNQLNNLKPYNYRNENKQTKYNNHLSEILSKSQELEPKYTLDQFRFSRKLQAN